MLTSFVGRQRERAALADLVGQQRLVTVTGPGGCGKTRLAREVLAAPADRMPAASAWVDLAPVRDPARVIEVVVTSVGELVGPAADPLTVLASQIGERALLVGFDNCEHLVDACAPLIEALLQLCPGVRVLATSRTPLAVSGERVWRVPAMAEAEVMALFVERAGAVRAGFSLDPATEPAVRTICRRLDGVPLAVELAAAWVGVLSPEQIVGALDDRFGLLIDGPSSDERQQTLTASVRWSYDLLDDAARRLLQALSVCEGDVGLDAVIAVAGPDAGDPAAVLALLRRLVDASLVEVRSEDARHRYRLHETIREFAQAELTASGSEREVRDRHLAHFLAAAIEAARRLEVGDQDVVLASLEAEHANFRVALRWSKEVADSEPGRLLARALVGLWLLHGSAKEGLDAVRGALGAAPHDRSTLQADLWSGLALLAMPTGHIDLIEPAATEALAIAADTREDASLARAQLAGCYVAFYSDYERCHELACSAQRHAESARAEFTADLALMFQMVALGNRDRYDESLSLADAILARARPRHRRFPAAITRNQAAFGALLRGDVRAAVRLGRDAVRIARPLHDYLITGTCTSTLGWALGAAGRVTEAHRLMQALVRTVGRGGPEVDVVDMSVTVGKLHLWAGQPWVAIEWLEPAAQFDAPGSDNWTAARALPTLSKALRYCARIDAAVEAAERGIAMARRLGTPHAEAESLDELGHALRVEDPHRALDVYHEACARRREHDLRTHLTDTLDHLALSAARFDEPRDAARLFGASDEARKVIGYPRPPIDRPEVTATRRHLRSILGDDEYRRATAEGSALDLEAAVTYATRTRGPRGRPSVGWASLTPTEHELVDLVADGLTNPQIAERLLVSRSTVKAHLGRIYVKLDIRNRAELAAETARRTEH